MTDDKRDAPREWWASIDDDARESWPYGRIQPVKFNHLPDDQQFKVIEKSAYDQALAEIERLKAEKHEVRVLVETSEIKRLNKVMEQLKAERDELRIRLELAEEGWKYEFVARDMLIVERARSEKLLEALKNIVVFAHKDEDGLLQHAVDVAIAEYEKGEG